VLIALESAGAASAGQGEPTEWQGDQPQHHGPGATHYSIAGTGTTCGEDQIQSTVDQSDQPGH